MKKDKKADAKEVVHRVHKFRQELTRACDERDTKKIEHILKTYHMNNAG